MNDSKETREERGIKKVGIETGLYNVPSLKVKITFNRITLSAISKHCQVDFIKPYVFTDVPFSNYIYLWERTHGTCRGQRTIVGTVSLLLPTWVWGSNSGS